jgi:multiple sugar transport system substrate-binding protein
MSYSRRGLLRTTLGAGAAGLAGVVVAACGGGQAAESPAPAPPKAVTGKVTWLVRNTAVEVDWEQDSVLPDVQRQLAGLTIDLIVSPGSGPYDEKLTALTVGGTPPDVWTHWGGRSYVDYVHSGWLAELTPLMARDKLDAAAFLPNTLEWFKLKGKQYALPFSQSYGSFLFYNKTLLDRAGLKPPAADWSNASWTWDAMLDMAKKATTSAGTPDATYGLVPFDTGQFLSPTIAKIWGGDIFAPEHYKNGIAQKTQLDSQGSIDAHQARQDTIFRLRVAPTPADVQALGVSGDLFQAGKIALYPAQGWKVRNYVTGVKDFTWGIGPIPAKKQAIGPNFTDAWMLGKQAPNKEGGWALIKYLLTADAQRTFARVTGTAPTIRAAEDEWFKLMGDRMPPADVKKVADGGLQHSFELPQHTFAKWAEINKAITEITAPLWTNQATAADALRNGKAQVDLIVAQAYQEYQGTL